MDYADTALESVVARVLESFTDQDRLEYAEKLYTINMVYQLHDTNGKTGPGCTPLLRRRHGSTGNYVHKGHQHRSEDWDPGVDIHLARRRRSRGRGHPHGNF